MITDRSSRKAASISQYVHGPLCYAENRKFILVQVPNALELATEGEYREIPKVQLEVDANRLKVTGERMVWPSKRIWTCENEEGGRKSSCRIFPAMRRCTWSSHDHKRRSAWPGRPFFIDAAKSAISAERGP